MTGALIVAEVVLSDSQSPADADGAEKMKSDLLDACRRTLAAHKVPALLRFVPGLELTAPASWCVPVRNVIVTGGSRGLGLAMCCASRRGLSRHRGCAQVSAELTAAAARRREDGRGAIEFRACDLSDLASIAPLVKHCAAILDRCTAWSTTRVWAPAAF